MSDQWPTRDELAAMDFITLNAFLASIGSSVRARSEPCGLCHDRGYIRHYAVGDSGLGPWLQVLPCWRGCPLSQDWQPALHGDRAVYDRYRESMLLASDHGDALRYNR
jgi:hypothetical protein